MNCLPFPRLLGSALLVLCLLSPASGQAPATPAAPTEEYATVAAGRADKIVAALGLVDTAQAARVKAIVADQYLRMHTIHAERDAHLAALAGRTDGELAGARAAVANETKARAYDLHAEFLARLSVELAPEQIERIKDGMTYGVLPLTYRVYQEMLPDLTAEQKRQILSWLIEAREFAMDAGSSDEKHACFGKYKGRINNYLSKAGIDMKQAEKAMLARKSAASAK